MDFKESLIALHQAEQKQVKRSSTSQAEKFAYRAWFRMKQMCSARDWDTDFVIAPIDHGTALLQAKDGTELRAVKKYDEVYFQARVRCPACGKLGWTYKQDSLLGIGRELAQGFPVSCPCKKKPFADDSAAEHLVDALIKVLSDSFAEQEGQR